MITCFKKHSVCTPVVIALASRVLQHVSVISTFTLGYEGMYIILANLYAQ